VNEVAERTRSWGKGCALMREDEKKIRKLMEYYSKWQNMEEWVKELSWKEEDILSYFEIREDCSGVIKIADVPIEPLVGFLRHPLYHCFERKNVVDKSYMFLTAKENIYPSLKRDSLITTNYYFDLGASTYTSGFGGSSQNWFVDSYAKRGIKFDRIIAWEAITLPAEKILKEYPNEIIGKVSYFNVPASTDITDKMSPIRIIKELVRPQDFLMLKIDIDNDPVELAIIKSFLNDKSVTDLIDEFFFEHHVSHNPVEFSGWGLENKINNITESYQLFESLRALGIRAHSWV
jgi:hypothetical protein